MWYIQLRFWAYLKGVELTNFNINVFILYYTYSRTKYLDQLTYFWKFFFKVTVSTILSDFLNRNFSPKLEQVWVRKNSSKTAKNTEKWFSRNISGKTCSQAICVWATLIQVNQDNSASVWWTAHARNRFVDENVLCRKI